MNLRLLEFPFYLVYTKLCTIVQRCLNESNNIHKGVPSSSTNSLLDRNILIDSLSTGINIEVVSLRRNWQKMKQSSHSSPSPTKEDIAKSRRANPNAPVNPSAPNNVELTYYTLSGKEVNIRDEIQRPLSVNGVYTRWATSPPEATNTHVYF